MKAATSVAADVAELVAEAYAAHERHTWLKARQEFAQELADTFMRMSPPAGHGGAQGVTRDVEECARVALRLAGLDTEPAQTTPDEVGQSRTEEP